MPATPAPITMTSWWVLFPSVMFHPCSFCRRGNSTFVLHYSKNPPPALASGCQDHPLEIRRKTLFESDTLQIGLFEASPGANARGEVERQSLNAIALPFSGVFSKHDAPGRHVIGTPSHAVFFAADAPYRIGFPGGIGDRSLTLRFGVAL